MENGKIYISRYAAICAIRMYNIKLTITLFIYISERCCRYIYNVWLMETYFRKWVFFNVHWGVLKYCAIIIICIFFFIVFLL